ncbi:MAG: transcription antitermination regulator [Modestobacter sp.]|jgi:GAF domain-containing protein|nr:transcription antitermination regulator [Modestobacter sp.]
MTDSAPPPGDATAELPVELSSALTQMAGLVLSRETVDTALSLITTLADATIAGTTGAGVTIVDEYGKRSKAASNELVEQADALQYEFDEGPCLTAWRTRQPVRIEDTATDSRWPSWNSAAARLGVRAVLSVALVVDGESIGAIKVYSDEPANYGRPDVRVMSLFAEQAAILLANSQSLQQARRLSRQLTDALASRDAVVRATGVLLARGAADQDAAFIALTDAARRSGQTVQQLARELLASVVAANADSSLS